MIDEANLARASWHKSTWSDSQGGCVSVARVGACCAVRDSKNVDRHFLVPLESWRAFVEAVKQGAFRHPGREAEGPAPRPSQIDRDLTAPKKAAQATLENVR